MSKEIIYNKLVRDKIPEIIKNTNKEPIFHIANVEETKDLLLKKLLEELDEFKQTPNEEELADLLEVIDGIGHIFNLNMADVVKLKESKKISRGAFVERIVLEKVIEKE